MDEVGPQVAGPVSIHNPIGRKRDLYYQMSNRQPYWLNPSQPQGRNDWNPKMWEWDSQRFEAKPVEEAGESLQVGQFDLNARSNSEDDDNNNNGGLSYEGEERRGLDLNLSSGFNAVEEETVVVSRPNKKVKSGSPGRNYPKCQVDNCKEDLTVAKDYHRRHKVCEVHSKATKALVGNQMQRFCQQCSR